MKQRSILLIFCLSLVPILLSAAAESPEERVAKRAVRDFRQRLSEPLRREEKISPREEDAQVVRILRGVSKGKKEGEERVTQAEIKATLKSISKFEALLLAKLNKSPIPGSGGVPSRRRRPSGISFEDIDPEQVGKHLLTRNKSTIN